MSLPDAAHGTLQASMVLRPVTRLAQQQPDLLIGDNQLQTSVRVETPDPFSCSESGDR